MNKIKVAAVQVYGEPGNFSGNFQKAEKYIREAKEGGAELVLFPELYSGGFVANPLVWKTGEEKEGPTYEFLIQMTRTYQVAIGIGYLENVNGHFCNRYLVMGPDGKEWARAEKDKSESYVFRRGHGAHLFDTPFGRMGIGICADNHFTAFMKYIQRNNVQLMIMPHALPVPKGETSLASHEDIKRTLADVDQFPLLVSSLIGVPTIFIDQTGAFSTMVGMLGKMLPADLYELGGCSKIVDHEGRVMASLDNREGVIMAEIETNHQSSVKCKVPNYSGWIQDGSGLLRRVILPIDIFIGKLYYLLKKGA